MTLIAHCELATAATDTEEKMSIFRLETGRLSTLTLGVIKFFFTR